MQRNPVASPFPSPALTFLLLGVKSLSKETIRNFTGKSKRGCRSERWVHPQGGGFPMGKVDGNPP